LKDKFGLSWQVVPVGWETMFTSGDAAANQRAMDAMYQMRKLDLAALQAAFDGKG
jgi:predicted 3-demethylubiquinone-9 3-methyltransferase (glyoxalase superfamily)